MACATSSLPVPLSPLQQHRGIGWRGARDETIHRLHRRALADQAVLDRHVLPQPGVLAAEPVQVLKRCNARPPMEPMAASSRMSSSVKQAAWRGAFRHRAPLEPCRNPGAGRRAVGVSSADTAAFEYRSFGDSPADGTGSPARFST